MSDIDLPSYWRQNLKRSLTDWKERNAVVGLLIVVASAFGYGIYAEDPAVVKWSAVAGAGYIALLLFVVTPRRMWRDSQVEIAEYKERLKPQLSFVFQPDTVPYLNHFPLYQGQITIGKMRLWRVGIRNDSALVIKRVRVVIESITFFRDDGTAVPASVDTPIVLEHALNVMGRDKKSGLISLSPGDRPTAFVDFVEQKISEDGKKPSQWMSPCYATGHRTLISARHKWIMTLRMEGGGSYRRASFVIEGSDKLPLITVRPHGLA